MSEPGLSSLVADVLVVDDEPRNCRLLEGYLASEGHRVRSAEDAPPHFGWRTSGFRTWSCST